MLTRRLWSRIASSALLSLSNRKTEIDVTPKRREALAVIAFFALCGLVLSGLGVGLMYIAMPTPRGLGEPGLSMIAVLFLFGVAFWIKER